MASTLLLLHRRFGSLDLARRAGGDDVKPSEQEASKQDSDRLIVDQLLRKLRRATPGALRRASGAPVIAPRPVLSTVDRPGVYPTGPVLRRPSPMRSSRAVGVWARAFLGLILGVAVMQWPYGNACGPRLFFYLTAVTAVVLTGVWAAAFAWRGRLGAAHVVALSTVQWGAALAAHEVLPRAGYAKVSATWWCADYGADSTERPRLLFAGGGLQQAEQP